MASDNPGSVLITSLVQGSQAPSLNLPQPGGKQLPGGKTPPVPAVAVAGGATQSGTTQANARPARGDPQSLVNALNKFLNDSGRPDQFRIAPDSRDTMIQEINPATGEVIGEFAVVEFPALARSVGATGLLVDSRA